MGKWKRDVFCCVNRNKITYNYIYTRIRIDFQWFDYSKRNRLLYKNVTFLFLYIRSKSFLVDNLVKHELTKADVVWCDAHLGSFRLFTERSSDLTQSSKVQSLLGLLKTLDSSNNDWKIFESNKIEAAGGYYSDWKEICSDSFFSSRRVNVNRENCLFDSPPNVSQFVGIHYFPKIMYCFECWFNQNTICGFSFSDTIPR